MKRDSLSFLLDLLVAVKIAVRYPSPTVNLDTDKMCIVYINKLSYQEPVFLDRDMQLWYPNGPVMVWKGGESTLIACPGKGNYIAETSNRTLSGGTAVITCFAGTIFTINGLIDAVNIYDVKCWDPPKGSVQNTDLRCGGGHGTLLDVGFDVLGVGFTLYFESCYDMVKASVIYTRHVIDGAAYSYRLTGGDRPFFMGAEIKDLDLQSAYLQRNQEPLFTQLLGSVDLAKYYIKVELRPPSILTRGHLTPDADGIFRSWRWATYFFVNAAPQWRVTNAGNWEEVEKATRDLSVRLNEEVLVYTGAHDILTLPHVNGQQVEITLKDDKIRVPKWYWKIIKARRAAIALVSYNNPYEPPGEMLCEDICAQYGWSKPNYRRYQLGYTYCCKVEHLRQAIDGIPDEVFAYDVLRYDGTIGSANGPVHDEHR